MRNRMKNVSVKIIDVRLDKINRFLLQPNCHCFVLSVRLGSQVLQYVALGQVCTASSNDCQVHSNEHAFVCLILI